MSKTEPEWLTRLRWMAAWKRGTPDPDWLPVGEWAEHIAEVAQSALKALDAAVLLPYPCWRHKVRRSTYVEIARATVSTNGPDEGKRVVVYQSVNYPNEVFARDEAEFDDGRFERL